MTNQVTVRFSAYVLPYKCNHKSWSQCLWCLAMHGWCLPINVIIVASRNLANLIYGRQCSTKLDSHRSTITRLVQRCHQTLPLLWRGWNSTLDQTNQCHVLNQIRAQNFICWLSLAWSIKSSLIIIPYLYPALLSALLPIFGKYYDWNSSRGSVLK